MPPSAFVKAGQLRSVFLLVATVLVSRATAACPAGSVQGLSAEACYKIYTDTTDWNSAEGLCNKNDGGNLASVGSAFENSFLRGLLAKTAANERFWIGGSGYTGDGTACRRVSWRWSDLSEWNYRNWAQGSPSCPSNSLNCVSFDASTGKWHDEDYTLKKPFVCLIEDKSQASRCADGWTYNAATNACYEVDGTIGDISADTWPTAQSYCRRENANLVTIHNAATNDDVLRYARDAGLNNNHFPIGLKYNSTTKAWTWTDGSAMDYTNWAPGYPVYQRNGWGQGTDYAYMWMYGATASLWTNDYKETYEVTLVLCQRAPQA